MSAQILIRVLFLAVLAISCRQPAESKPNDKVLVLKQGKLLADDAPLHALLREFENQNPGVRVIIEELPASTDEQHQFYVINLQGRSGDFDVFPMDIIWVQEFARAGWVRPVGHLIDENERSDFFTGAMEAVTLDGELYAIPWRVDAGVLYYRKDLLEKFGAKPPKTWDELVLTAKQITAEEPGLYGFIWQGRQSEGLVCNALEYLWTHGGDVPTEDGGALLTKENLGGARLMRDLITRHGVTPDFVTTMSEEPARRTFENGKALFMRNWPYAWRLFQSPGSVVKDKVGITTIPHEAGAESHSTLGGWNLGINRYSRNPELAEKLAVFLTSEAAQRKLAIEAAMPPARKSPYSHPNVLAKEPLLGELYPVFEHARPRPPTPYYMMISQVLQLEFSAIVSGIRTPEEALRRADEQMAHIFEIENES